MNKRILVTGASGFVGSHLIEFLQAQGYREIFGTSSGRSAWLENQLGQDHVIQVNLTKQDEVFSMLEQVKPDWIFHLAALAFVGESFQRAMEVMENNTALQYTMLEGVRTIVPQARVLSVGSAASYGLLPQEFDGGHIREDYPLYPSNPYAVSKTTQDHLALSYFLAYQLDVVRVRPFNQIGPRQTESFAIPAFAKQVVAIERGEQKSLKVGNLEAVRDFTDVRDAVRAYELLMREGKAGEVYNIGSGHGVSMQEALNELLGLSMADIMVEVDQSRLRPVDVPVFVADNHKLRQLGWSPRLPLRQTLADVLEYERKQG